MHMTPYLEEAVREWMALRLWDFTDYVATGELDQFGGPEAEMVLRGHGGEPIFPIKDFKRSWTSFRKMAGLERMVFHELRHHYASTLVQNGAALTTVRELMGHKDIRTTNIYLSVRDTIKQEAQEELSRFLQRQSDAALGKAEPARDNTS